MLGRQKNGDAVMTPDPEIDCFSQAGDYVLGFLNDEEMQAFEAALALDEDLQGEVARTRQHYAQLGYELEDPEQNSGILRHLKRELWAENWMPWRRRIRIWEFALGGIAAALVAYGVTQTSYFAHSAPPVLQTSMLVQETGFELRALLDPTAQVLHVEWQGSPEQGQTFHLWAKRLDRSIMIADLDRQGLLSFKLTKDQLTVMGLDTVLVVSSAPSGDDGSQIASIYAQGLLRTP